MTDHKRKAEYWRERCLLAEKNLQFAEEQEPPRYSQIEWGYKERTASQEIEFPIKTEDANDQWPRKMGPATVKEEDC